MKKNSKTPGAKLRAAIRAEKPLQVIGTINAYSAMLAERAGFRAIYLSGAGVANASYGLPDLGFTTLEDVCTDTGWENPARTVREMIRAGAAGCHFEDQVSAKRCGHRPGKRLVSSAEMCQRIKSAASARGDSQFIIMARTDAHAVEGIDAAIARSQAYIAAGADMIFAEALTTLDEYKKFTGALRKIPVLANITEFGRTPLFTTKELGGAGARLVLYPLSAFRAMSHAAENIYAVVRKDGTQRKVIGTMQTRAELYDVLNYHAWEKKFDAMLAKQISKGMPKP